MIRPAAFEVPDNTVLPLTHKANAQIEDIMISKVLTFAFSFFIFLSFGSAMSNKPISSKRLPNQSKTIAGKSSGYVQVNLIATNNGQGELKLVGQIKPNKAMKQSEFLWKIPSHIEILSGDTKGIVDLAPGQLHTQEIVLSTEYLKHQDQIFFLVYKKINGENYGTSQSYIHKTNESDQEGFQKKQSRPKKIFH